MAQKMIEIKKKKDKMIQTEDSVTPDFFIQLNENKYIRLYKSRIYKDYILTLNTNHSKKIVITRSMWKILRNNSDQIDGAFLAN